MPSLHSRTMYVPHTPYGVRITNYVLCAIRDKLKLPSPMMQILLSLRQLRKKSPIEFRRSTFRISLHIRSHIPVRGRWLIHYFVLRTPYMYLDGEYAPRPSRQSPQRGCQEIVTPLHITQNRILTRRTTMHLLGVRIIRVGLELVIQCRRSFPKPPGSTPRFGEDSTSTASTRPPPYHRAC
jgi:hypothetical protein